MLLWLPIRHRSSVDALCRKSRALAADRHLNACKKFWLLFVMAQEERQPSEAAMDVAEAAPLCSEGVAAAAVADAAAADVHMGEAVKAEAGPSSIPLSQYKAREDLPDLPGYRLRHTLRGHGDERAAVPSVRFDPQARRLASAGSDGTAVIWDVESGEMLHQLKGHQGGLSDLCWSPDGRYLATASDDTMLRVWDAATGACLRVLSSHTHYAVCCAFNAGGNLLVSGGYDEVIIVWDVRLGRAIKIIPGHSDPVSGVAFGGGSDTFNELIASCSFDGLTRVWHTNTGRCQASLTDRQMPALSSVRFTPNGRYLLTSTFDSRLQLWDPLDRKVKKTYSGHLNNHSSCQATFVVHSPDAQSKYVASGSEDHHAYCWDLNSRQIIGILRGRPSADAPGDGHCSTVLALDAAVQVGRQLIATGGQAGDGTVKIWQHEDMGPVPATAAAGAAAVAVKQEQAAAAGAEAAAEGAVPTAMDSS